LATSFNNNIVGSSSKGNHYNNNSVAHFFVGNKGSLSKGISICKRSSQSRLSMLPEIVGDRTPVCLIHGGQASEGRQRKSECAVEITSSPTQ
jgi:hypothetical protein